MNRYKIASEDGELFFYFDVEGKMMGGISIPIEPREIIQHPNNEDREINPTQHDIKINEIELESLVKELPPMYGEDTARIFIDIDNNWHTGYFSPHCSMGADLMGLISGKNGKILIRI